MKPGDRCAVFKKDGGFIVMYFAYEQDSMCYFTNSKTDAITYRSGKLATKPAQHWARYKKLS